VKISAANDCNIFWDSYSLIHCVVYRAHCQWIVEAEQPVWSRLKAQELSHGVCTALLSFNISFEFRNDVIINDSLPSVSKCLFVPIHSAYACTCFGAANVGNPLAADLNEVPGGYPSDRFVVDSDKICGKARQATID